jgi:hypothetical protein
MVKTTDMFNIKAGAESKKRSSSSKSGDIVVSIPSGKRSGIKSSKYSKDEIDKLLVGYVSIPQIGWAAIDHGAHVRYVRLDGRFVRGGFVSGYSMQNGRRLLTLANGFNATAKGYSVWTIGLDSIKFLYVKKASAPSDIRIAASPHSQSKTSEITMLKKTISDMQKRLKKLECKSIKK